jgi:ABC-2 type transport system ATP-binding protein
LNFLRKNNITPLNLNPQLLFLSWLQIMEKILEVKDLHKKYKDVYAVKGLNLSVNKGDIYGFLGPNGAGKSTTLRMIVSLIKPTSGEIEIFGDSLTNNPQKALRRLGALIEKPDFYKYLTAYQHLEMLSAISGVPANKQTIIETLELVGLAERAHSRVKTFSQGMRQRLGLAQTIIHNPELIILDEPANGLDPQGMKDMREMIVRLNQERGLTIILSSHILHEVEMMATRMVIIHKGIARVEGTVKELLDNEKLRVKFEVENFDIAKQLFTEKSRTFTTVDNNTLSLEMLSTEISGMVKTLSEKGAGIKSVIPTRSLEEYFVNITAEE